MRRLATVIAVLVAFPAAALASSRGDTPAPPSAVARMVACDMTSPTRSASFYARMETVPGASKLQLRFQLLERLGRDDTWSKLDVPALRGWHTSQPGVKRFGWKQTVDALRVGGAYKARVQYRWLSAAGAVVSSDSHDTPVCRGLLPNIAVGTLTVKPGPTGDTRVYRVIVSNTGKIAASNVDVSLSVDRAILDTVTVSQLAVGESRTVSFTGPNCRRSVRVKADPDNSIGETLETDNSQLYSCP
jgi:hypothetical protein